MKTKEWGTRSPSDFLGRNALSSVTILGSKLLQGRTSKRSHVKRTNSGTCVCGVCGEFSLKLEDKHNVWSQSARSMITTLKNSPRFSKTGPTRASKSLRVGAEWKTLKTCCSVLGHEQHQVAFVVCTPSKVAGCLELFTSREQMVTDISEEAILAASRLEEENTHKNQRRACGIL